MLKKLIISAETSFNELTTSGNGNEILSLTGLIEANQKAKFNDVAVFLEVPLGGSKVPFQIVSEYIESKLIGYVTDCLSPAGISVYDPIQLASSKLENGLYWNTFLESVKRNEKVMIVGSAQDYFMPHATKYIGQRAFEIIGDLRKELGASGIKDNIFTIIYEQSVHSSAEEDSQWKQNRLTSFEYTQPVLLRGTDQGLNNFYKVKFPVASRLPLFSMQTFSRIVDYFKNDFLKFH